MSGALLVAGTASDAGKTVVVAGICRWLARRGLKVAPFKAQNMALNSTVTADGAEIGRAQAMQAAAAGVEAEAAMNPVLLKPSSDRRTQVVVLGHAAGSDDAAGYQARKADLLDVAADALADLRARYDVVVCEGAGSPAEINLRAHDLANMGLARRAGLPVLVVGDIDRGGVLAGMYGTLALLEPADQALVAGFLVNKFRGDPDLLQPGLDELAVRTGRPTLGVLPWVPMPTLDAEDSLALEASPRDAHDAHGGLDIAVVRLPRISNFTDLDPLAAEPDVTVRFTASARHLARADLVVVPGTKATVADLAWLRKRGLDAVLGERARRGTPVLGICGGYQLLGEHVTDTVESAAGHVAGLGLLPVATTFADDKVLARRKGTSPAFGDAHGYEIRHGRIRVHGGEPLMRRCDGEEEGCVRAAVIGTSWHGVLEADGFRRALLAWVARRRGARFQPGERSFAALREDHLDALGDLVASHVDTSALQRLLDDGVPAGLPALRPSLAPADERTPEPLASPQGARP